MIDRHQRLALGRVALMVLCSSVGSVTAEEKKPTNAIRITEATYGGNCAGVAKGNVTKFVASTCDGTDLCNYRVYYKDMGGDPAEGCRKAFRVNYTCGKNRKAETCALEAEAGMGGDEGGENKFCLLHCLREGSRERRKAKPKEEGTRRAVDRPPPTHCTSGHTKPITIITMAMAVSRLPRDWLENPKRASGEARIGDP